jgi:DNA topoisomerase-2
VNNHNMDSTKYRKLNPREHVLVRPTMYVGSIAGERTGAWVADGSAGAGKAAVKWQEIDYVPGLLKIVDEPLANAMDHSIKIAGTPQPTRKIEVWIDQATGWVRVRNDGSGVPTGMNTENGVRIPELIFGSCMSGSNFDEEGGGRVVAGMNGLGVKLTNIFSKEFVLSTVDTQQDPPQLYVQRWRDNMSSVEQPKMTKCVRYPYTEVSFLPDYARFGVAGGLTDDMLALMRRRVFDVAACSTVPVWLDGAKLPISSFERYVDMYVGPRGQHPRAHEVVDENWEVAATYSERGEFMQVSFVNGVSTLKGGKHVEHVCASICKRIVDMVQERRKRSVRPSAVREVLALFVRATVPDPTFDSQSKETLVTPVAKFATKCVLSDRFFEALYKTRIVEMLMASAGALDAKEASKTDGAKRSTVKVPKLDDAPLAGGSRSSECVLLLTEGDSARSSVLAGLSATDRSKYGVFPLKGKLLNTLDCAAAKVNANKEIAMLKQILGLQAGKEYTSVASLRYGTICLVTDADQDGAHIRGLLINMFNSLWPSLVLREGFLQTLQTPLVKVSLSTGTLNFYSMQRFEEWRATGEGARGAEVRYLKGLGSSTEQDSREWFSDMRTMNYVHTGEKCADALGLAFSKTRADDRKGWLLDYDHNDVLEYAPKVTYSEFVHRELKHFSAHDLSRSIPSVVDGLKPSQRKILYACFKRNLITGIRVSQLAGYVSEVAAYHHGEASLTAAIVGMAQEYVGTNNLNLLHPQGMFGTRLSRDSAASPRYIHTHLTPLSRVLFQKDDDGVLRRTTDDDGEPVEPVWYVPIIPLVLVNGALGIGTGFSTAVPSFHVDDVVRCMLSVIDAEGVPPACCDEIEPHYQGFAGTVRSVGARTWVTAGRYERAGPDAVLVTELPVGTYIDDYREFLADGISDGTLPSLREFTSMGDHERVRIELRFSAGALDGLLADGNAFEKSLRLVSKQITLKNMHMFDAAGRIRRYDGTGEVFAGFYQVRLATYHARREMLMRKLERESAIAHAKADFVQAVISSVIVLNAADEGQIEATLRSLGAPLGDDGSYDYLLTMPMRSVSAQRVEVLRKQAAAAQARLEVLAATTPHQMWRDEIGELTSGHQVALADRAKRAASNAAPARQPPRKKPAVPRKPRA